MKSIIRPVSIIFLILAAIAAAGASGNPQTGFDPGGQILAVSRPLPDPGVGNPDLFVMTLGDVDTPLAQGATIRGRTRRRSRTGRSRKASSRMRSG